jgi:hypothetical protein
MPDNYLITGYWGEPHVTAENDRGINAAMFGTGRFVLPVGEQFRAEYIGNNTIRMYDGKLMDNGAAAGIPVGEYVDLLIANAGQGMKRNDLIVFQYSQDASTLIESGKFVVVRGTETSGTASDPELAQEDLLSGEATFDQMALWRVSVSGANIAAPVKVFSVTTAIAGKLVGEDIGVSVAGQLDTELKRIYSSMPDHSTKIVTANLLLEDGLPGGIWHITIHKTNNDYGKITAETYTYAGDCRRTIYGGTWNPWEYENPPLHLGVEYRTTERWEGAPVYTVLVDCGNTAANAKTEIRTNILCGAIIRIAGRIGGYTTPYIYEVLDSRYTAWATAHNQNGVLQVNTYASADTGNMAAKIQVWYTK